MRRLLLHPRARLLLLLLLLLLLWRLTLQPRRRMTAPPLVVRATAAAKGYIEGPLASQEQPRELHGQATSSYNTAAMEKLKMQMIERLNRGAFARWVTTCASKKWQRRPRTPHRATSTHVSVHA